MTGWPQVRLGEHIRIKHGFAFEGEFFSDQGEYIVLTPGNFIESGGFKPKSGVEKYYTTSPPDDYVLQRGDLVIAMTEQAQGLLGSSALIPADNTYLHNQRIGLVEQCSGGTDRRFLYYLFNTSSVRNQIQATATGSKVRHTAPVRVESVTVRLPPLDDQRKIAGVLSAYDEFIENNNRRIKLLEEMAQRIYREWFVDFRYPGHESVPLVDSEVGPIPEAWEAARLGSVAENFDRKRKPLSGIIRGRRPGPYPYYGAAKIFDYIDDYIFDGTYLLMAEDGSVITPGGVAVLQYVSGKFWANNHTHILRGTRLSTEHLYLLLANVPISGYITGAAQPKITQANLNRIPCVVPRNDVAAVFNAIVQPVFRERQLLDSQIGTLRAMRDLLLPRLISGEIDVTDLNIAMPEVAA